MYEKLRWIINDGLFPDNGQKILISDDKYDDKKADYFTKEIFQKLNIDDDIKLIINNGLESYQTKVKEYYYKYPEHSRELEIGCVDLSGNEFSFKIKGRDELNKFFLLIKYLVTKKDRTELLTGSTIKVKVGGVSNNDQVYDENKKLNAKLSEYENEIKRLNAFKKQLELKNISLTNTLKDENKLDTHDLHPNQEQKSNNYAETISPEIPDDSVDLGKNNSGQFSTEIDIELHKNLKEISKILCHEKNDILNHDDHETEFIYLVNLAEDKTLTNNLLLSLIKKVSELLRINIIEPKRGDVFDSKIHSPFNEENDSGLDRGTIIKYKKLGLSKEEKIIEKSKVIIAK